MDILAAGRDRDDNGAKKMSRAGEEGKQQKQMKSGGSFWAGAAMALKNRGHPGGENKRSTSSSERKKKKKKTTIGGRSMSCAGSSICGTKESAVLSRGSRRSSAASSSRSLKAPGGVDAFSSVSVSALSSFNSETTAATTVSSSLLSSSSSSSSAASGLSSPLSSVKAAAGSGSFRKKKLPGGSYYECHSEAALDPSAAAAAMAMMLPCAGCDEFFLNADSLELHKSTSHAVSELGASDTSRSVVEIIFRSGWKKNPPPCRIERILKVRSSSSSNGAAARLEFERYRACVMESAAASGDATRCSADGNELLRFHSIAFHCSLGLANGGGGAALCRASPPAQRHCELCGIIRDGFCVDGDGRIATAATSGLAHDMAGGNGGGGEKRAMLVCRVVAGRVRRKKKKKKKKEKAEANGGDSGSDSSEEFGYGYDSVSRSSASCSSELDELFVFDPRAILPCFVVIYTVAD